MRRLLVLGTALFGVARAQLGTCSGPCSNFPARPCANNSACDLEVTCGTPRLCIVTGVTCVSTSDCPTLYICQINECHHISDTAGGCPLLCPSLNGICENCTTPTPTPTQPGWCTSDAQCNDGIDCTSEVCNTATGYCTVTADNSLCVEQAPCTGGFCAAKRCYGGARVGFCAQDADCDGGNCTGATCTGGSLDGMPCIIGASPQQRKRTVDNPIPLDIAAACETVGGGLCLQGGVAGCGYVPFTHQCSGGILEGVPCTTATNCPASKSCESANCYYGVCSSNAECPTGTGCFPQQQRCIETDIFSQCPGGIGECPDYYFACNETCTPPTPSPTPTPTPTPSVSCGCAYNEDYWESPRFRRWPIDKNYGYPIWKTCSWPKNTSIDCNSLSAYFQYYEYCDQRLENDKLNCGWWFWPYRKWLTMQINDPPSYSINSEWWDAARWGIAMELNLLNGACDDACNSNTFCDEIRAFFAADVAPFLEPTGQSCYVVAGSTIGTCGTACEALCAELSITTCTMSVVLEAFNEFDTDISLAPCPNASNTDPGCCAECNCYEPACSPSVVQHQTANGSETQMLTTWEVPEEGSDDGDGIEIATLIIACLIFAGIVFILIVLYTKFCRPQGNYSPLAERAHSTSRVGASGSTRMSDLRAHPF